MDDNDDGRRGDDDGRRGDDDDGRKVFIGTRKNNFIVGNRRNNLIIGSRGDDKINGKDGFDTVDYRFLGRKITLKAKGVIDKGNVGTDQIVNIEKLVMVAMTSPS